MLGIVVGCLGVDKNDCGCRRDMLIYVFCALAQRPLCCD